MLGYLLLNATGSLSAQTIPPQVPPKSTTPLAQPTVQSFNLIHVQQPAPKEIKLHDLVTVIVNEKSQVTVNSQFNRTKRAQFQSEIKEFVKFGDNFNLLNAAANEPTIDLAQNQTINNNGKAVDAEGINYRIAAEVTDILPNGNLVLEARKEIITNQDRWEYTLTGICRYNDIASNNTIQSESIADLKVVKNQKGKIFDSSKRGWGTVIFDYVWPF
jgi:flagellar L-ring protein precursor FlgH